MRCINLRIFRISRSIFGSYGEEPNASLTRVPVHPLTHPLLGRFEEGDSKGIEIAGWKKDIRKEVCTGFGSEGGHWTLVSDKSTKDVCEADNKLRLKDGAILSGRYIARRISDDKWEWTFTGKNDNGQDVKMTARYQRK